MLSLDVKLMAEDRISANEALDRINLTTPTRLGCNLPQQNRKIA
jgi:hypothetical protein